MGQDYKEAIKWLGMAADAGNAEAQFKLGSVLFKEAIKWLQKSKEQGYNEADVFLRDNIQEMQKLKLIYENAITGLNSHIEGIEKLSADFKDIHSVLIENINSVNKVLDMPMVISTVESKTVVPSTVVEEKEKSSLDITGEEARKLFHYIKMEYDFSKYGLDLKEECISITALTKVNIDTVIVPESIDDIPVRVIDKEAFKQYKKIKQVILPDTVLCIFDNAFSECTSLTDVTLSNELLYVGNSAFSNCNNLKNVELPKSVMEFGKNAFMGCSAINKISIFNCISEGMFIDCTGLSVVNISDSINYVANEAFRGCNNLKEVKGGENISKIGKKAFYKCSSLMKIDLSKNVEIIEESSFEGCSKLQEVEFSDKIRIINKKAFAECGEIESINFPESIRRIANDAFYKCFKLQMVMIPDFVTFIPSTDTTVKCYESKIGAKIVFGNYDNTPIEWRVLDIEDDKALLISQYALDCKRYNEESINTSWEKCTLRKWLNSDFLNSAFNSTEQNLIQLSTVTADENPEYDYVNQGNDTKDKVFLLSAKEAEQYFKNDEDRKCNPTEFTVNNGAYKSDEGQCWWWLRSLGNDAYDATYVVADGSVRFFGALVDSNRDSVRPALWINLKS